MEATALVRALAITLLAAHPVSAQARPNTDSSAFTADLLRAITANDTDANVVLSPFSIRLAVVLAQAGATGETEAEIGKALHLPELGDATAGQFAARLETLANSSPHARFATSVWVERSIPLLPEYVARMRRDFGSHAAPLAFGADPESARRTINAWISQHTDRGIAELLPAKSLDSETRAVLASAVRFRARWQQKFHSKATRDQVFHAPDGDVQVPFMRATRWFGIYDDDDLQAISLPFEGRKEKLTVFLPGPGRDLADVAESIDRKWFHRMFEHLRRHGERVELELPKFAIDARPNVTNALKSLGIARAFRDDAEFDRMSSLPLKFAEIAHAARIEVDERGVEASAATAVRMAPASAVDSGKPLALVVDRPFLFTIHDVATQTILFCGRCAKP